MYYSKVFPSFLFFIFPLLLIVIASIYHNLFFLLISLGIMVGAIALLRNRLVVYVLPLIVLVQIYIPGPIQTLGVLFFIIGAVSLSFKYKNILNDPLIISYLIYIFTVLISLIYAESRSEGLTFLMRITLSVLPIIMGLGIRMSNKLSIEDFLKAITFVSVPFSLVNLYFFLYPASEIAFLKSEIADFFVNPNTLNALFNEGGNNILDPAKAGTFFVNTNVGSVYFNILIWITFSLFLKSKKKIYLLILLIHLLGLLACNSRAAIIALAISIFIVFLIFSVKSFKTLLYFMYGIPSLMILIVSLLYFGGFENITERLSLEALANDSRIALWTSITTIVDNYFLGLGFGRWAYYNDLPPHNIFLITWIQSGVIGLISLILFFVYILKRSAYQIRDDYLKVAVFSSTVCVIIQGLFDNYFLNDIRVGMIYFLIVAMIIGRNNIKTS